MTYQQLKLLKKLCSFKEDEIKILLSLSTKDFLDVQNTNETEAAIKENSNTNIDSTQEEGNVEGSLINISKAQLFHLKRDLI